MLIPKYWAKAKASGNLKSGRPLEVWACGYSLNSQNEAEVSAFDRAQERLRQILEGKGFRNGYSESAVCEPIVVEVGKFGPPIGVVTRNRQGCLVLNTDRVAFIDIDRSSVGQNIASKIKNLFSKTKTPPSWEEQTCHNIESQLQKKSGWGARIYRTKGGIRVLLTHQEVSPTDPELLEFMEACHADPLYLRLCERQASFRARLSPKPHRIKIKRPAIHFPFQTEKETGEMLDWIKNYSVQSKKFQTCLFLKSAGSPSISSPIQEIVDYHDRECRAQDNLPLA